MKIVIAGATGKIGGAALQRLLALPAVTSVIALSRRKIDVEHPKLTVAIIEDFLHYEPGVLEQLSGSEACIWSLGTPTGGRDVHMDYTMAAVKALKSSLKNGQQFRFVYVSGALVETDQSKTLWFMGDMRRMRGEVENAVVELGKDSKQWTSFFARPSLVTEGESVMRFVSSSYIPVATLGAALVDLAVVGGEQSVLNNGELRERGKSALKAA
ncbi:unnamed protein product [Zymoseptoria tritici ST99CH_1A5]|uniref:NAD(P)-binding domain-containing protein n=2 Tax=Zymoseptoria tritici TaxID=1047171 RepID=F9X834_ZYMTI|nr:uncharacterized protein MYCGRDRAFT_99780 [Zymoseptoria tritici IPO323]EGP87788.1 hypothetical protein MYCGRDRAFT_99780 [Zymoseptoria tritici IPO323]SMY23219.1 unnamed protein product [Zymoseptoria tritici ST99CH_1A5]